MFADQTSRHSEAQATRGNALLVVAVVVTAVQHIAC